MKKKIQNKIIGEELNSMMGEKYKQDSKVPAIHIERNLPKGVESEWGRMLREGKIKKAHLKF